MEGQEQLVALILEPYGDLVDDLISTMATDETACFRIDGTMSVDALRRIIADAYDWATRIDHGPADACARFWYVSEEKLEPRLGQRHEEPGGELEEPLDISRALCALDVALSGEAGETLLADFLLRCPEYRHTVRRVQIAASRPYSEIRENLIDATMPCQTRWRMHPKTIGPRRAGRHPRGNRCNLPQSRTGPWLRLGHGGRSGQIGAMARLPWPAGGRSDRGYAERWRTMLPQNRAPLRLGARGCPR